MSDIRENQPEAQARQLVCQLYDGFLNRAPSGDELSHWAGLLELGRLNAYQLVQAFADCDERKARAKALCHFPDGHYHSPVVDRQEIAGWFNAIDRTAEAPLAGIVLSAVDMRELWLSQLPHIQATPFDDNASDQQRYGYCVGPFPEGDAITCRMMINHYRPKRVIEIGSGASTACILDSIEHASIEDCVVTCVESYPSRLKALLRKGDLEKINLIESKVQAVDPSIVDVLYPGDILFIDSTHVLKTCSDVNFELFHLLPRLRPGVIVHFHDIMWPFEYPEEWVQDENYSWNEAYALRAYLVFNSRFKIKFWPSYFAIKYAHSVRQEMPIFLKNPGSSLWLEVSET